MDHMWYLYMIIGLYMLFPLLKVFLNYSDRKTFEYVLIILFIFTCLIPTFTNTFHHNIGFSIPISSAFMLYLLSGHYIHQYNIHINNKLLSLLILIYILYITLMAFNQDFVDTVGNIVGLNANASPLIVMATISIFCFIRQNVSSNKIVEFISPLTFGMYLIHPLIINILFKFFKFTPDKYPLMIVVTVTTVVTIILSLLFTLAARKIKIVRKYIL